MRRSRREALSPRADHNDIGLTVPVNRVLAFRAHYVLPNIRVIIPLPFPL
jgi:hypothetical protein